MPCRLKCRLRPRVAQYVVVIEREDSAVLPRLPLLPDECGNEVLLAIEFIAHLPKASQLGVVDGEPYRAFFAEQVPREVQPRVHHIEPLRMEATVGVGVGAE